MVAWGMHLRLPGSDAGLSTSPLLCIHSTGAWSYGGDEGDDAWPVVAAFEV